jgi:hypothetical protein
MAGAASAGVRVPRVVELREDALVLERIDGPTMHEVLQRRPWQVRSLLRTLARLQEQVAAAGLVHLDLHHERHPLAERPGRDRLDERIRIADGNGQRRRTGARQATASSTSSSSKRS